MAARVCSKPISVRQVASSHRRRPASSSRVVPRARRAASLTATSRPSRSNTRQASGALASGPRSCAPDVLSIPPPIDTPPKEVECAHGAPGSSPAPGPPRSSVALGPAAPARRRSSNQGKNGRAGARPTRAGLEAGGPGAALERGAPVACLVFYTVVAVGARDSELDSGGGLPARAGLGIFFLALVVRLWALTELAGSPWNDVLLGDARHFDEWGQRIAAGDWRGGEVFYQAPLYPYFLGCVYALFGHATRLVRVLQCCLGALAATWIARGTRSFASPRASVAAGCLAALYAPAIWYDLQIEKTSLATSLSAALFLVMVTRSEQRTPRWPVLAGITLGALTLLRENAAILLLPLAWAFGRERSERARRLAALAAGFARC